MDSLPLCGDYDETQLLADFVPPDDAVKTPFVKESLAKEPAATHKPTGLAAEVQDWKQVFLFIIFINIRNTTRSNYKLYIYIYLLDLKWFPTVVLV